MSFSSEVKEELARQLDNKRHCRMAELMALLEFCADSGAAYEKKELLEGKLSEDIPEEEIRNRIFGEALREEPSQGSGEVWTEGAVHESCRDALQERDAQAQKCLTARTCCKRAYLRGAFLASGSISNPEKSYHFEIVCQNPAQARHLQELYREFELDAKIVRRKKYYIVYIKEGAQIVDALNIMGAHVALMNLENVRILREMRGSVNRIVNCETANIGKVVGAACRQIEDIHYIESKLGLGELPPALREMALLRLNYPDSSLAELGELCDPPVGKSGVNHRLRKLSELAKKLGRDGK